MLAGNDCWSPRMAVDYDDDDGDKLILLDSTKADVENHLTGWGANTDQYDQDWIARGDLLAVE